MDTIRFESIAYGAAAVESHETFKRLRDRGIVAPGLRFQISLPLHESAMRVFLTGADDLKRLWEPYGDAMKRELDAIFTAIPARELSIQWDVCTEMLAHDPSSRQLFPWEAHGEPLERYTRSLADLSPRYSRGIAARCTPVLWRPGSPAHGRATGSRLLRRVGECELYERRPAA